MINKNTLTHRTDEESREKISGELNRNFFVIAGAGSGKTTELVNRMVKMVESGIPVDKICTITFTKAAANEFYSRFYKKLSDSNSIHAKTALRNIDLCFMGTIDSFCNTIVSEHPAEAGVPSDSSIVSDSEIEQLYFDKLNQIKRDETSSLHAKYKAFRMQFWNADEIYKKGLTILLDKRNASLCFDRVSSGNAEVIFGAEKKTIIDVVDELCRHPEWKYLKEQKSDEAWETLSDNTKKLHRSWNGNLPSIAKILKSLCRIRILASAGEAVHKSALSSVVDFKGSNQERFRYYFIQKEFIESLILRINEFLYSTAMTFICSCLDEVSAELKEEGKLTYFDYLLYLRNMLRKDAENGGRLIRHIQKKYRYYLLDEFQDTSPLQYEVFFYLAAKEPKPDWRDCEPMDGALFIVGDPKQSIYRFKNADIASYNNVRDLFKWKNGEVITLSRNFRSNNKLIRWFNGTFSESLADADENKGSFTEIPLENDKEKCPEGKLAGVFSYEASKKEEDVAKVSVIVRNTVRKYDYNYSDIMIITPRKDELIPLMRQFKNDDIPFFVEGSVAFEQCPALVAVYRVLCSLANGRQKCFSFEATHLSGCEISEKKVKELSKKCSTLSPSAVFIDLMEELDVFKTVGTDNAEYLYYALELLRNAEAQGSVSTLSELAAFIGNLIGGMNKTAERCLQLVKNTNAVHMANLHKVKGLEAPVVILAGLSSFSKNSKPNIRISYEGKSPQGFLFRISSKINDSGSNYYITEIETAKFEDEEAREKASEQAERARFMYVAATRAQDALIVVKSEKGKNIKWATLSSRIERSIVDAFKDRNDWNKEKGKTESDSKTVKKVNPDEFTVAKQPSYKIEKPSMIVLKPITEKETALDDSGEKTDNGSGSSKQRQSGDGALKGTLIHRLMEVLVSSRNTVDVPSAVKEIVSEYDDSDRHRYHESMLVHVADTIRNGGYEQKYGAPKDILKEVLSADEIMCEVPFCLKEDRKIYSGVMDLVYRKNDEWHIIDYKTNADDSGLDEHYSSQLETYSNAFRKLTGNEVETKIYYIDGRI